MEQPIEKYEHEGLIVSIYQDELAESPRECDNVGKMLIVTNDNYSSPINETELTQEEIHELRCMASKSDIEIALSKKFKNSVILPIYRYAHSGVWYNTTGFNNYPLPQGHVEFDTCHVGYIIATRQDILNNFGIKKITQEFRAKTEALLRGEVDEYSKWANGEVYGFVINDENSDNLDSVWGFYDIKDCKKEAEESSEFIASKTNSRIAQTYMENVEMAGQQKLF